METNQVDPNNRPHGYYFLSVKNSDLTEDNFYFNKEGFRSFPFPPVRLGNNVYWSSSSYLEEGYSNWVIILDGNDGRVNIEARDYSWNAVRCVRGQ